MGLTFSCWLNHVVSINIFIGQLAEPHEKFCRHWTVWFLKISFSKNLTNYVSSDAAKAVNNSTLISNLHELRYRSDTETTNLTCANDHDQEISCPNGCCVLQSTGKSAFVQSCRRISCQNLPTLVIESNVVGDADVESSFTYRCNKPMCNSVEKAGKVRALLKNDCLLTPTGLGPCGAGILGVASSRTSVILQATMILVMIFFKWTLAHLTLLQ